MESDMVINIEVTYKTPGVPNFIVPVSGSRVATIPIHEFTDDELRMIGLKWTEELIRKAQSKRK